MWSGQRLSTIAGTTDRSELARIMTYPRLDGFLGAGTLVDVEKAAPQDQGDAPVAAKVAAAAPKGANP